MAEQSQQMVVRLKKYNPREGQLLHRYTYRGIKFEEGKGWYKVPSDVANYLREVRSIDNDPYAPLAFEVMTQGEAIKLDEVEYRRQVAAGRLSATDAPRMSPRDTTDQDRGLLNPDGTQPARGRESPDGVVKSSRQRDGNVVHNAAAAQAAGPLGPGPKSPGPNYTRTIREEPGTPSPENRHPEDGGVVEGGKALEIAERAIHSGHVDEHGDLQPNTEPAAQTTQLQGGQGQSAAAPGGESRAKAKK